MSIHEQGNRQVVEIIITTPPEYGRLDSYFFYKYMVNAKRFSELAQWFGEHSNVSKAIDILARHDLLKRRYDLDHARNICAV